MAPAAADVRSTGDKNEHRQPQTLTDDLEYQPDTSEGQLAPTTSDESKKSCPQPDSGLPETSPSPSPSPSTSPSTSVVDETDKEFAGDKQPSFNPWIRFKKFGYPPKLPSIAILRIQLILLMSQVEQFVQQLLPVLQRHFASIRIRMKKSIPVSCTFLRRHLEAVLIAVALLFIFLVIVIAAACLRRPSGRNGVSSVTDAPTSAPRQGGQGGLGGLGGQGGQGGGNPSLPENQDSGFVPGAPTPSPSSFAQLDFDYAPVIDYLEAISDVTFSFSEGSSEHLALEWLHDFDMITYTPKMAQRFALVAMDFALSGRTQNEDSDTLFWSTSAQDECTWEGVLCDEGNVTEISFARLDLDGTIPTVISMLSDLRYIDLSYNQIQGSIPEELYQLSQLENLYLYKNQLTGTLSSKVGDLSSLVHLHLNQNKFSGSIPSELRSIDFIRPLRFLNLYKNQFTGTIPLGLRLRYLFYFDVAYNQLTGTLPEDIGNTFIRLRHLHLNNNRFVGTIPPEYASVGNGRLWAFTVENNQLTGSVPSDYYLGNLVEYTLYNNNFSESFDKDICKMSVFQEGEVVEFKADCDVCSCQGDFFCETCEP